MKRCYNCHPESNRHQYLMDFASLNPSHVVSLGNSFLFHLNQWKYFFAQKSILCIEILHNLSLRRNSRIHMVFWRGWKNSANWGYKGKKNADKNWISPSWKIFHHFTLIMIPWDSFWMLVALIEQEKGQRRFALLSMSEWTDVSFFEATC